MHSTAPGFATDHVDPLLLQEMGLGDGLTDGGCDARIMEQISTASPGSWIHGLMEMAR